MTESVTPEPTPEQAAMIARVRRLMLIAGLITMVVIGLTPGRSVRVLGKTLDQLKWAIVTVMRPVIRTSRSLAPPL